MVMAKASLHKAVHVKGTAQDQGLTMRGDWWV